MPRVDRVRAWLAARGCPAFVVDGGLAGLVARWEKFAAALEAGYPDDFDEYRNDVDTREILHGAWAVASEDERRALGKRVRLADERARGASVASALCVWGSENARKHGWSAGRNWWYFMEPIRKNAQLAKGLASRK